MQKSFSYDSKILCVIITKILQCTAVGAYVNFYVDISLIWIYKETFFFVKFGEKCWEVLVKQSPGLPVIDEV